jgi:acyl-CoA reductase-like NAD-dependent aldehyde dehydrogenase
MQTLYTVLYTGGSRVASIVLTAAAKTLSPVTTEVSRGTRTLD